MLPNVVIVGAQKSGTTTLHHILASHPSIFVPSQSDEIHFFDLDENYRRGIDWYESLFAGRRDEPWVAQTSPFYMYERVAVERMQAAIPTARIIAILRDPVARAYSHYWHEVRYGWEPLAFEAALAAEPDRLARLGVVGRRHFSYVDRSRYAGQIERLQAAFGADRVLVLTQDELEADPPALVRRLASFLEIDVGGFSARATSARQNVSMRPRIGWLQRLRPRLERTLPRACGLLDRLNLVSRAYPAMQEPTRRALQASLAPDLEALAERVAFEIPASWRGR